MWGIRPSFGGMVFVAFFCISITCYAQNEETAPSSYIEANASSEFVETSQQPSPPEPMVSVEARNISLSQPSLGGTLLRLRAVAILDVVNNTEDVLSGIIWTKDKGDIALGLDDGTTLRLSDSSENFINGITVCQAEDSSFCFGSSKKSYVTLQPKVPVRVTVTLLKGEDRSLLAGIAAAKTANFSAFLHIIDSNDDAHLLPLNLSDIPIKNSVRE